MNEWIAALITRRVKVVVPIPHITMLPDIMNERGALAERYVLQEMPLRYAGVGLKERPLKEISLCEGLQ